jgi:hypothetical protein
MAALGATVPPRKDAFQALAAQPLTQAEMACHTGLTNRTAFGLVQARLEVEVHPELIANGFLYGHGVHEMLTTGVCVYNIRGARPWGGMKQERGSMKACTSLLVGVMLFLGTPVYGYDLLTGALLLRRCRMIQQLNEPLPPSTTSPSNHPIAQAMGSMQATVSG